MTYIEVLEKMIERKREELKTSSAEIASLLDNFSKRKFIELGAELKTLETCLDLAQVMFDEKEQ